MSRALTDKDKKDFAGLCDRIHEDLAAADRLITNWNFSRKELKGDDYNVAYGNIGYMTEYLDNLKSVVLGYPDARGMR